MSTLRLPLPRRPERIALAIGHPFARQTPRSHRLVRRLAGSVLWMIFFVILPRAVTAQDARSGDRAAAPPRILAHYMPWYEAKPHSPHWGWHWTMGVFDPEGKTAAKTGDRLALSAAHRPVRLGRPGRHRISRSAR